MEFAHFAQVFPRTGESARDRYDQLWREIQLCDELRFDYAFGSIHHLTHLRPQAAVFVTMAAERTKNLRVGAMGYTVALYNPIRIVEETAVLDNITGGRLEVGLTAGVTMDEFRVYGADWADRSARAREALELLVHSLGSGERWSRRTGDQRRTPSTPSTSRALITRTMTYGSPSTLFSSRIRRFGSSRPLKTTSTCPQSSGPTPGTCSSGRRWKPLSDSRLGSSNGSPTVTTGTHA